MQISFDATQIRRGALFFAAIGVPVVFAVLRGDPQQAQLGAVLGLTLAFADNDKDLPRRLRLVVADGAGIALGAAAGFLVRNFAAATWPSFIVIAFATGLSARRGRETLIVARNAAMAFAVGGTMPAFDMQQIWYPLGVLLAVVAARAVDHWLCGPLPLVIVAPTQRPSGYGGWLRFACAYAVASTMGLWVGNSLDPTHRFWIVITTLLVMLPDANASYRRIVERIAGTSAGVVAAWAITVGTDSMTLISFAILIVAPFIPHHIGDRYWLHTALIALVVMLAYDLTALRLQGVSAESMADLLMERMKDILIGCAMALIGTIVAFPRDPAISGAGVPPEMR
ncbi:MAG: FUSC family protein [Xanthobacteraceae bacterium]